MSAVRTGPSALPEPAAMPDDGLVDIDSAGLRVLGRTECLALLATTHVGRIAVSARALPLIAPVRFVIDGDRIVISIRSGPTLDAATRDTVVAFEADGPDGGSTVRWSVHVNGIARHVTNAIEQRHLAELPLPARTFGRPQRLVTVSIDRLAGRAQTDGNEPGGPPLVRSGVGET